MKELTLLEKFNAGWEIRYSAYGARALHIYQSRSNKNAIVIEWLDGTASMGFDADFEGHLTCTPPRERRWVNVWVTATESGYMCPHKTLEEAQQDVKTDKLGGDFIATICIERVDGRWVLVDEKGGDK